MEAISNISLRIHNLLLVLMSAEGTGEKAIPDFFYDYGESFFFLFALTSVLSFCLYHMLMSGIRIVQWTESPGFALLVCLTGMFSMFMAIPWMVYRFSILAPLPIGVFGFGTMRLPIYVFGGKFSNLLTFGSTGNIRNLLTGDRARAALARGDVEDAERLFKEEMCGKPKRDTLLHLALGNMYRDQKRLREAIAEWQFCLQGDPPPDIYMTTSMRLAELLGQHMGDREEARNILSRALNKYPKENEATAIKKRLENLS